MRRWSSYDAPFASVALVVVGLAFVAWGPGARRSTHGAQPTTPRFEVATSPSSEALEEIPASARQRRPQVLYEGPTLDGWAGLQLSAPRHDPPVARDGLTAVAFYYRTGIFRAASAKPRARGYARRGRRLAVARWVKAPGCQGGAWYELKAGGFVCTRRGFRVSRRPIDPAVTGLHYVLPNTRRPLPYSYAKVIDKTAIRLYRLPDEEELSVIDEKREMLKDDGDDAAAADDDGDGGSWAEVVERQLKGAFFLALQAKVYRHLGRRFVRTVYGRYADRRDVKLRPLSPMHGELLGGGRKLPLAFVWGDADAPIYRLRQGRRLVRAGLAEKHARFAARGVIRVRGRRFVRLKDGLLVPRKRVRLLRRRKRPAEVDKGDKWIHVDLAEQSLVAYEGTRPVFATLISGGVKGHEAPAGTFRVAHKHITVTMSGEDDDVGWYEVEEVPWTMYYWDSFALHGAYWHADFGKPRSHGCTNLAPADARWLFYWAGPELPAGWHGIYKRGETWIRVN